MSRISTAFVVLLAALVIAILAVAAAPGAGRPLYMNSHAGIRARVNDLLHRMTLEEKVGQMDQIGRQAPTDVAGQRRLQQRGRQQRPLQTTCLVDLIDYTTGSILSGGTDNPANNTGRGWANQYNMIQQYAIENSRLHVPVIFGVDAVHGFGHPWQAPLFPQSIGMGATWDPSTYRSRRCRYESAAARDRLASGTSRRCRTSLATTAGAATTRRGPRNPRSRPHSAARTSSGLQGGGFDSPRCAATVKHFAGYSQSINGHDRVEAQLPIHYLQDIFLPSYAGGIDAGAATVMVDSGSINNVPATSSHFLLTEELRHRMGFKGVVISDYGDVPALQTAYHIAADFPTAIAQAVNAGVDVSMTPFDYVGWNNGLIQDVQHGLVSEQRIDQSVKRILTLKFELGLFDHPYVDPAAADAAVTANRDLAKKAADESITLLRNQGGALPLSKSSKIVVTGPSADSVANQLGGWSVSWQGVYDPGNTSAARARPTRSHRPRRC